MEVDDAEPAFNYYESEAIPQNVIETARILADDSNDQQKTNMLRHIKTNMAREGCNTSDDWVNCLTWDATKKDYFFNPSNRKLKKMGAVNQVNRGLGIREVQEYELRGGRVARHFEASELPMMLDFKDLFVTLRGASANENSPFWMQRFGFTAAILMETAVKTMRPGCYFGIANEKVLPSYIQSMLKAQQTKDMF